MSSIILSPTDNVAGSTIINHAANQSIRSYSSNQAYLYAMREDLADWLKSLYAVDITVDNFFESLGTGLLLCQHANNIMTCAQYFINTSNLTIPKQRLNYNQGKFVRPGSFFARDNVASFIAWCRKELSIPESIMFETNDLVHRVNEKNVILCLLEVARRGSKFGIPAPVLVQMEQDIDQEIEEEECEIKQIPAKPRPQKIPCDFKSLDEMVQYILGMCTCPDQFPMIKVSDGKYKVGDSKNIIFLRILRQHVMVRVGGGWDTLEHYLDKHDPCRCKTHRIEKGLSPRTSRSSQGTSSPTRTSQTNLSAAQRPSYQTNSLQRSSQSASNLSHATNRVSQSTTNLSHATNRVSQSTTNLSHATNRVSQATANPSNASRMSHSSSYQSNGPSRVSQLASNLANIPFRMSQSTSNLANVNSSVTQPSTNKQNNPQRVSQSSATPKVSPPSSYKGTGPSRVSQSAPSQQNGSHRSSQSTINQTSATPRWSHSTTSQTNGSQRGLQTSRDPALRKKSNYVEAERPLSRQSTQSQNMRKSRNSVTTEREPRSTSRNSNSQNVFHRLSRPKSTPPIRTRPLDNNDNLFVQRNKTGSHNVQRTSATTRPRAVSAKDTNSRSSQNTPRNQQTFPTRTSVTNPTKSRSKNLLSNSTSNLNKTFPQKTPARTRYSVQPDFIQQKNPEPAVEIKQSEREMLEALERECLSNQASLSLFQNKMPNRTFSTSSEEDLEVALHMQQNKQSTPSHKPRKEIFEGHERRTRIPTPVSFHKSRLSTLEREKGRKSLDYNGNHDFNNSGTNSSRMRRAASCDLLSKSDNDPFEQQDEESSINYNSTPINEEAKRVPPIFSSSFFTNGGSNDTTYQTNNNNIDAQVESSPHRHPQNRRLPEAELYWV